MHLLERYALSVGNRIKKPYTNPHYFPIGGDYVVFCESKLKYSHWAVVNFFCFDDFKKNNIKTVLIGEKTNNDFECDLDLRGVLNFNQSQFVIKNAKAFVGEIGVFAHIAGVFNIPSVVVFGTPLTKINCPFWKPDKYKFITPKLKKGFYHAFSEKKQREYSNTIPPEVIQKSIFDLLKIKCKSYKTISVGSRYKSPVVDIDVTKMPSYIPDGHINIRADKGYNLEIFNSVLRSKKCEITLSAPINIEENLFKNISSLNYLSQDFDVDFIKKLKKFGVKYTLLCTNKKRLSDERFKLFDEEIFLWDVEQQIKKAKKNHKFEIKNANMISMKKILSGKSNHLTWHDLTKKEEDFWLDLDWLFVYV